MFAYIPARAGSKRITRKNIRRLGDKPVILHVIETLGRVKNLTGIAVSSEDTEIAEIVRAHGIAETLELRDEVLADSNVNFLDLAREDTPRYASHFGDQDILFITATAVLIQTKHIEQAQEKLQEQPNGLVLGVTEYSISPALALEGSPEKGLRPLFPEMYIKPTVDLPRYYSDSGCFYAFDLSRLEGINKFLEIEPARAVVLPEHVGIDVDTETDWYRLEKAFHQKEFFEL